MVDLILEFRSHLEYLHRMFDTVRNADLSFAMYYRILFEFHYESDIICLFKPLEKFGERTALETDHTVCPKVFIRICDAASAQLAVYQVRPFTRLKYHAGSRSILGQLDAAFKKCRAELRICRVGVYIEF